MFKKITLAVAGLAASGYAAVSMGAVCTPGNVTVPCEASRWNLGLQALYLKTLYEPNKSVQFTVPNNFVEIKNDWSWGFRALGSYEYQTGSDVAIDWIHYSSANNAGTFTGGFPVPIPPASVTLVRPYEVANRNRFDQLNMVMGQQADFGVSKTLRFFGGMQYANVQTFLTKYFQPIPALFSPIQSVDQYANADFRGWGPTLGIDYSYHLIHGGSLVAHGSGALLYGTTRYNAGYIAQPVELVFASAYAAKKTIVPTMQMRLGINYACQLGQGIVNWEAGYQAINYFNVFQTQTAQGLTNALLSSNYGLYGPYFEIKYTGNA